VIAPVSFFRAVFAFFFVTFTSPFHRSVTDGDKPKNGHRHASHLYRLYPAAHIMPATPENFATAENLAEQPTRQRLRSLSRYTNVPHKEDFPNAKSRRRKGLNAL
jgi:hypothetical protein